MQPPPPPNICTSPPDPQRYFSSKFFLWMPRRKWQIPLYCTNCSKKSLTAKGLYNRLRTVIDVDCFYFIGAEYLECKTCRKCYISWSKEVMDQLDLGHAMQFPATLTHRGACDSKVVTLLRARTLGNSSTALHHNIEELHSEAWLRRTLLYLTDCETHSRSIARFAQPLIYQPPLPFPGLPNYRRLMSGYVADVYRRLTELKAQVTSTYGSILKLDSTKKIIKKMAGKFAGSASWVANVGNERGEVLMSVLTASEGQGLKAMAQGLVKRYRDADEAPPSAIYVDRDCCCLAEDRQSLISAIFAPWQSTIRLDIWHFIRRFSVGCSTDSHALYGTFMSRLSACIFAWDESDLQHLREAKAAELCLSMEERHVTPAVINGSITKAEMRRHCRRKTRGVAVTSALIQQLIDSMADSTDSLGMCFIKCELLCNRNVQYVFHTCRRASVPSEENAASVGFPASACALHSRSPRSAALHPDEHA
jgi:hypothetical protein